MHAKSKRRGMNGRRRIHNTAWESRSGRRLELYMRYMDSTTQLREVGGW